MFLVDKDDVVQIIVTKGNGSPIKLKNIKFKDIKEMQLQSTNLGFEYRNQFQQNKLAGLSEKAGQATYKDIKLTFE